MFAAIPCSSASVCPHKVMAYALQIRRCLVLPAAIDFLNATISASVGTAPGYQSLILCICLRHRRRWVSYYCFAHFCILLRRLSSSFSAFNPSLSVVCCSGVSRAKSSNTSFIAGMVMPVRSSCPVRRNSLTLFCCSAVSYLLPTIAARTLTRARVRRSHTHRILYLSCGVDCCICGCGTPARAVHYPVDRCRCWSATGRCQCWVAEAHARSRQHRRLPSVRHSPGRRTAPPAPRPL